MIKIFTVNRPQLYFSQEDFEENIASEMKELGITAEDVITILKNGEIYEFFYRSKN